MSLGELRSRAERGPKPVYLVYGDARPLVVEAVGMLEEIGLGRAGLPAFNHDAVRCGEGAPERALSAARTPPVMGELRVVVVREIESGSDAFYTSLVGYLQAPSPTTVLILAGARLPKQEKGRPAWARKIRDLVKKAGGEVVQLDAQRVDPRAFATERARSLGKRLDRAAASLLVDTVGDDLDRLQGEVDKLALYVGEADGIGVDAVRDACALLAEAEIWDLTAALAARDRPVALAALYRLLAAGDEPRRILSMIAWQARQLLQMAELARSGATDDAIRRSARMRWDTFKRVRPLLDRAVPAADRLLRQLATANRAMNSHRAGAERVLEGLVLDMLA